MLDYIIVGQGIAGAMLSWFLLKAGKKVCVIDSYNPCSASNIASGIINPITGRRFVKTWLADELIPFAVTTYQDCEKTLGQSFLKEISIIKLFDSIKARNNWSVKCGTGSYKPYLKNEAVINLDKNKVDNEFGGFEINGGLQLDVPSFLASYRKFLSEKQMLVEETFDIASLKKETGFIIYKNIQARGIIFCEGASAIANPYFRHLPFLPAKGECLIADIPDFYHDRIINGQVFIMPLDKANEYYVGSTSEWDFENDLPSERGRKELEEGLHVLLKTPYKIIGHHAAIRPTVKDRRPFIGLLNGNPRIGIFNGMGTKGISLAPYFANQFTEFLMHGKPLSKEVDIGRIKA